MKNIILQLTLLFAIILAGCTERQGIIRFENQYDKNGIAIFIDGVFSFPDDNQIIKGIEEGNHHIVIKGPNKTYLDTTIFVNSEWSTNRNSNLILGASLSVAQLFIPYPIAFIPYVVFPIPIIASHYSKTGEIVIQTNSNWHGYPLNHSKSSFFRVNSDAPSNNMPQTKNGIIETRDFCVTTEESDSLLWAIDVQNSKLAVIPTKYVTFCRVEENSLHYTCNQMQNQILQTNLCPKDYD